MLLLAGLQIILRFFGGGLFWIDPMLRLLVIWAGLLGAVVATREKQHIAIDLISYLLPQKFNHALQIILALTAALICAALCWQGIRFIHDEAQYGGRALLGIPSWQQNSIFALSFALMSLHFLLNAVSASMKGLISGQPISEKVPIDSRAQGR
jgi:C4-dicarboxylate transporter DctQ subunit